MRVTLKDKICYIEGSPWEIRRAKSILTWRDKNTGYSYYLFRELEKNRLLETYWGIYFYLKDWVKHELVLETDYYPILLRLGKVQPKLVKEINPNILPGITLFPHQVIGIRKALLYKVGVLEMATSSGKTFTFIATIKWILENEKSDAKFLVVVPSEFLLEQTYKNFLKVGFNEDQIGLFYGKRKELKQITIGVINSINLAFKREDLNFFNWHKDLYGLILDEFHRGRSDSYKKLVLNSMHAEYILGYTGSPFKESVETNFGDAIIQAISGGIIYRVTFPYLVKAGLISRMYVYFEKLSGQFNQFPTNWNSVYEKYVVENKERNEKIIEWIRFFQEWKVPTLVLVQRLAHGKKLLNRLNDDKSVCIFGGGECYICEHGGLVNIGEIDYSELKRKVENREILTIIASQVMDEGVDLPEVGAVIMAGAGKSSIKLKQRIGRGARKGSTGVSFLLDFKDIGHVYLYAQYKKRKKLYQEQAIEEIDNSIEFKKKVIEVYGKEGS